jgi:RNA polymerase sigma-70 factor (ECF subfamily)
MAADQTTRLFDEARGGTPEALDALYTRAAAKLLPLIRLRMGRALRAEIESRDILQAVMLKSFQKLPDLEDGRALMAWLSRIAENEIRDRVDHMHRQRRDVARREPLDEAADVPAPIRRALTQAILTQQSERLEAALEMLSPEQRELIVLRAFEELTFPEIATRVGKSDDACRMAFARAMAALTMQLAGDR